MKDHDYYSPVIHYGADVSITDSRSYSSLNVNQSNKITTTEQLPLFFPIPSLAGQDPLQSMLLANWLHTKNSIFNISNISLMARLNPYKKSVEN